MDFSQQILQHQLLLFQWKLKFLSSKWLLHVVSERCDIARFSWLGTLLHLELWKRVRVLFFSLAFYGIFWDAISGYKVINSALAELLFFWRSFKILHGFVQLFCDWFWAFHSFWTHGVRVWIQIKWITFRLTGTFKEKENQQICGTLKYSGKQKYIALGYYEGSKTHKTLIYFYLFLFLRITHSSLNANIWTMTGRVTVFVLFIAVIHVCTGTYI